MRTRLSILVLILAAVLTGPAAAGVNGLANSDNLGLNMYFDIEKVLRLEDEDIDLATAALILSREWGTPNTLLRYRNEIDEMAKVVLDRMHERSVGRDYRAIEIINEYLFQDLGFQAVKTADNPNDLFLHEVLVNRRGYCLSLSVLYLAIGERVGLPLYGVVVPGHFFVRYDDGRTKINIETTSNGATPNDAHYVTKFKPPDFPGSIYMDNLTKVQTLGCFFNNLGNSYSDVGDIPMAKMQLERAVRINPTLAEARTNLGNIYLRLENSRGAIDQYVQALKILKEDAKIHNNLANAYMLMEHHNKAVSHFTLAIRYDPEFLEPYKNLALLYQNQKQYSKGINQLKQAIKVNPNEADVYRRLGDLYAEMEDFLQAESSYRKALWLEPSSLEAHVNLGYCYMKQERLDEAADSFARAIQVDPYFENAYFALAQVYNKKGLPEFERVTYEELLRNIPDSAPALQNLANNYLLTEEYEKARMLYVRAIELNPDNAGLYYNVGVSYMNEEKWSEAKDCFLQSVGLDYHNADAHNGLAVSAYMLGEHGLSYKHAKVAKQLGYDVQPELLKQ